MTSASRIIRTLLLTSLLGLMLFQCKKAEVPMQEVNVQKEDQPVTQNPVQTIHFNSMDGLEITADLYRNKSSIAPIILLFHQAGFSRGEYSEIAPKLVDLGFTCIALDQRSGDEINGVVNQTKLKALEMGKGTEYVHALPDLLAAVGFTKAEFNPDKLIIWGSSYSASLAFILANIHREDIDGLVTFSPGLYFEMNGKSIIEYAATLDCPTFMTCSREEAPSRMGIFEAIPHAEKTFFIPELEGYHGSKALWSENAGNEAYWDALTEFLKPFVDK